jgi:tetrahydromethanopterin S-methyltransferase subunit G
VNRQEPRSPFSIRVTDSLVVASPDALRDSPSAAEIQELERQVEFIVDDCFFTVGQVVGMRTTLDYEAVIWWRNHYRAKFLAAMKAFGNRWTQDRANVTSVAIMLAERAVRYSEGKPSIDAEAARRAAADVERHCELHARRAARRSGLDPSDASATRIAGYWCTF